MTFHSSLVRQVDSPLEDSAFVAVAAGKIERLTGSDPPAGSLDPTLG